MKKKIFLDDKYIRNGGGDNVLKVWSSLVSDLGYLSYSMNKTPQ